MSEVKIKVEVDTSQANNALKTTQQQLAETAASAVKADSAIANLGKSALPASASLGKAGTISGATGEKIKALGKNISEAAIQTEAFSGVSQFAEFAQLGLGAAVISGAVALYEYLTRTTAAAQAQKDLSASLDNSAASVQGNVVRLQALVSIAQDVTKSDAERKEAIGALNKEYDGFNKSLDISNINTEKSIELINKQTSALVRQAQIKGLENLISKEAERQAELLNSKLEDNLTFFGKIKTVVAGGIGGAAVANSTGINSALDNVKEQLTDSNDRIKLFSESLKKLLGEDALEGTLFSEKTAKQKTEKIKAIGETIADVLSKLRRNLALTSAEEDFFGIDKSKEKIREIESAINTLVNKFKLNPDNSIIQGLFGDINSLSKKLELVFTDPIKIPAAIDVKDALDKARKDAAAELGRNPLIKPIKLPFKTDDIFKEQEQRLRQFIGSATDEFSKLSENIFSGIGEALGSALTGAENPIGGFFLSIGNLLADSIQNLGKYIITTSTLVAKIRSVLNAAFAGNPALGIAVGVGLIAVGSALKSSLPKFADGVRNFGGGLAIVGERGPEVVRLPSGSDVIPNHRINGMAAGEQTVFIADTRISGSDIVLSYTRQTNRNSRNGF